MLVETLSCWIYHINIVCVVAIYFLLWYLSLCYYFVLLLAYDNYHHYYLFITIIIYLFIFTILSIYLSCGLDLHKVQPSKYSPHIRFTIFCNANFIIKFVNFIKEYILFIAHYSLFLHYIIAWIAGITYVAFRGVFRTQSKIHDEAFL